VPVHELRVLANGAEARVVKWLCPYKGCGGNELVARSAPFAGQQRQCPTCAKRWTLKGDPIPPSLTHRFKAVKV